jgi:hypothetical protein
MARQARWIGVHPLLERGRLSQSRSFITVLAAVVASAIACNENPIAPTGLIATIGCSEVLDGYQCQAGWAISESGPVQDVTGLATWSTSDTSIATVDSVGFVKVVRAGNVAIRASYRGADAFITFEVVPGGLRRYYFAVSGFVTDSQDATKIPGVTVRILNGPNTNRTATTGTDGAYQMYDLQVGTFTMQFSKAGYVTLNRSFTLTGDKFNDASVTLVRSPS